MTRARPDTAAAWVARLGSDQRTRADDEAFEAWLAADPAHASQYAEHTELWDGLRALSGDAEARAAGNSAPAVRGTAPQAPATPAQRRRNSARLPDRP